MHSNPVNCTAKSSVLTAPHCSAFPSQENTDFTQTANGTFLQLSPLDVASCDQMDNGCQGGSVSGPWDFAKNNGVVTEACRPYLKGEKPNPGPVATCAPDKEPCTTFVATPSCASKCANGASYSADKHKLKSVYTIGGFFGSATQMMTELKTNGPFGSAFTVYAR